MCNEESEDTREDFIHTDKRRITFLNCNLDLVYLVVPCWHIAGWWRRTLLPVCHIHTWRIPPRSHSEQNHTHQEETHTRPHLRETDRRERDRRERETDRRERDMREREGINKSMQQNQRCRLFYSTHSSSSCITHNATFPLAVVCEIGVCYACSSLEQRWGATKVCTDFCSLQLMLTRVTSPEDIYQRPHSWRH